MIRIERLGPAHEQRLAAAEDLLDGPVQSEAARRFLNERGHHMLVAYVADEAAGFITGVEMTHPDKGTEMFLYELGVAEPHRRHGVAGALVKALRELALERGCYGMWVLCDEDNEAARKLYEKAGGRASRPVLFDWSFEA